MSFVYFLTIFLDRKIAKKVDGLYHMPINSVDTYYDKL